MHESRKHDVEWFRLGGRQLGRPVANRAPNADGSCMTCALWSERVCRETIVDTGAAPGFAASARFSVVHFGFVALSFQAFARKTGEVVVRVGMRACSC
jgi:hypothetical protein